MVVDVAADVAGRFRVAGPLAPQHVLLPVRRLLVLHELAAGGDRVLAEELDHLVPDLLELLGALGFGHDGSLGQGLLDGGRELPVDVAVDHLPLVVHDAVDSEVQVGAVELEELAEEVLEPGLLGGWGSGFGLAAGTGRSPFDVEGVQTSVMRWGPPRRRPRPLSA